MKKGKSKIIYINKQLNGTIVFDDFTANSELNTIWVEMCPKCFKKYKSILTGNNVSISDYGEAQGICSVKGCQNEADYYVDFIKNEIKIKEE